jgi:4-amino-4-deoxy-L-arabinose transferase-like glycosyltransferase
VLIWTAKKATYSRAIILGIVLGLSALCKQTFFIYLFLIPLLLICLKGRRVKLRIAITTVLVGVVVILPWTIRNYNLTGRIIPVHGRMDFNIRIGDLLVQNFSKAKFSLQVLWDLIIPPIDEVRKSWPPTMSKSLQEVNTDAVLLKQSLNLYKAEPFFMAKKILVNAVLFWSFGESPRKSAVLALFLIPLFLSFLVASWISLCRLGLRTVPGIVGVIVLTYWLMHTPIQAIARYSVVLVPAMLIMGGAFFSDRIKRKI